MNRRDDPQLREAQHEYSGVPLELPAAVKDPCNECPWRRKAAPGYLGPHTAQEWAETAHSEQPIMCHKTCNSNATYDDTRQCRGAAIFRANVLKHPRRSDIALGPEDKERVFASTQEFIEHHEE